MYKTRDLPPPLKDKPVEKDDEVDGLYNNTDAFSSYHIHNPARAIFCEGIREYFVHELIDEYG